MKHKKYPYLGYVDINSYESRGKGWHRSQVTVLNPATSCRETYRVLWRGSQTPFLWWVDPHGLVSLENPTTKINRIYN